MVIGRSHRPEHPYTRARSARLRLAREACGASQAQIAERLGLTADGYAKYENRPGSELPARYFGAFCEATGIPLGDLAAYIVNNVQHATGRFRPRPKPRG